MLWWLCSGPVTCCIINVSKPDSFDGCRHHLGPGSHCRRPCRLADNAARHAASVSTWGFIQVVMAPTIRADKTDFSSYIFCRYSLHPYVVAGASFVYKCTCVLLIRTDDSWWQAMTAASCHPQLCSAPSPARVSEDSEHPPVAPGLSSQEDAHSPVQENILLCLSWPWQPCRQSETQCTICCDQRPADPGHQPLSTMYTLSDIWTDDFYKVGGMQLSVKCSISLLFIISSHKIWVIALMFICNSEKNQKMFFDRNHQKKQLL